MSYFQSYGGWRLHETETVEQAAQAAASQMLHGAAKRIRVVEVEIWSPQDHSYQYAVGYTMNVQIPPHRKEVRDGDCTVKVIHHLTLLQGSD